MDIYNKFRDWNVMAFLVVSSMSMAVWMSLGILNLVNFRQR